MLLSTGNYTYQCGDDTGSLTIVPSQYTISLCKDCTRKVFHVTAGDSVQWVVVPEGEAALSSSENGCTVTLRREEESGGGEVLVTFPTGEY